MEEITEKAQNDGHSEEAYKKLQSWLDSPDIISKSFQSREVTNAIKMLVDPGDDVSDLTMRGDFPERRFLVACARHLAKCRKFGYEEGERELLFIVSGLPGVEGKRASMLVDAVIGERRQFRNDGFLPRFKKAAGLGE